MTAVSIYHNLMYVCCLIFSFLQDEAPLLNPNVLICSVGTEIFYRGPDGNLVPDQAWTAYLDQGWDKAQVQELAAKIPQLTPQVRSHTCQFLCLVPCAHLYAYLHAWRHFVGASMNDC